MNINEILQTGLPVHPQPFTLSPGTDCCKKALYLIARMPELLAGELDALSQERVQNIPSLAEVLSDVRTPRDPAIVLDAGINAVLTETGTLLGVSRVVVMLDEKDGRYLRNAHEWVDEKIEATVSSQALHDHKIEIPSLKPLTESRDFLAMHTREAPPDIHRVLVKRSVESVLLVPLIRDGVWAGVAAFDSCGVERDWLGEEIIVLRHLAQLVSLFLDRLRYTYARQTLEGIRELVNNRQIINHLSLHDADVLSSLVKYL